MMRDLTLRQSLAWFALLLLALNIAEFYGL